MVNPRAAVEVPGLIYAAPFSVGPGVSELHFANARDGWASGATLWATYDGGRSWHQADLGGPVAAVASGAGEAYAMAPLLSPRCEPAHLRCATNAQRSPPSVVFTRFTGAVCDPTAVPGAVASTKPSAVLGNDMESTLGGKEDST